MEISELLKLGFNKNEARVYFALIGFGRADAGQIISETKFHKNIVYDNLEKLIDKGLISFIIEDGRKVFQIASSNALMGFFEEKEEELKNQKAEAEKITKEINKIAKSLPSKQEAIIYRGVRGLKEFYLSGIERGEDSVAFGAPQDSIDIMGETFWRNLQLRRQEKNVHTKLIFNPSIRDYGETIKNKFTEVKYFERDFEPMTETHVQGDEVGIVVWTKEPFLFLIKDKHVAESYLKFFEKMWKHAKI